MAKNPYIDHEPPPPPKRPYRLVLRNTGQVIEVDPERLPEGQDGLPGSILSLLLAAGVDVEHACGGVCACSTCHVYVHRGYDSAPPPIEEEEDQLDYAPAVTDASRLACQCVPDGSAAEVEVEIPGWSRNEVKEEH